MCFEYVDVHGYEYFIYFDIYMFVKILDLVANTFENVWKLLTSRVCLPVYCMAMDIVCQPNNDYFVQNFGR
jgi:hypothetical protein